MSICDCNQGRLACSCKTATPLEVQRHRCLIGAYPNAAWAEMVRASEFDAAQSELATLREELDTSKRNEHNSEVAYKAAIEKQEELREDFDIVSEERDNAKRNASAFEERMGNLQVENGELQQRLTAAEQRNAELEALLDTPHTSDWFEGVKLEAGHQIKRWGSEHDAGKGPADWFWLIGYLAQKAMGAQMLGNDEKAKHHTISTGAALLNWFRAIAGDSNVMRPGIDAACAKPTESGASE